MSLLSSLFVKKLTQLEFMLEETSLCRVGFVNKDFSVFKFNHFIIISFGTWNFVWYSSTTFGTSIRSPSNVAVLYSSKSLALIFSSWFWLLELEELSGKSKIIYFDKFAYISQPFWHSFFWFDSLKYIVNIIKQVLKLKIFWLTMWLIHSCWIKFIADFYSTNIIFLLEKC